MEESTRPGVFLVFPFSGEHRRFHQRFRLSAHEYQRLRREGFLRPLTVWDYLLSEGLN